MGDEDRGAAPTVLPTRRALPRAGLSRGPSVPKSGVSQLAKHASHSHPCTGRVRSTHFTSLHTRTCTSGGLAIRGTRLGGDWKADTAWVRRSWGLKPDRTPSSMTVQSPPACSSRAPSPQLALHPVPTLPSFPSHCECVFCHLGAPFHFSCGVGHAPIPSIKFSPVTAKCQ